MVPLFGNTLEFEVSYLILESWEKYALYKSIGSVGLIENYLDNYVNDNSLDSPTPAPPWLTLSYKRSDNDVSKYFFFPNTLIGPVSEF